jgi:hypothetical protein
MRKDLSTEFVSKKMEANSAVVQLAARALLRNEVLKEWLFRWRRLLRHKASARAAAAGMRRRFLLRSVRRSLGRWARAAAAADGARRGSTLVHSPLFGST